MPFDLMQFKRTLVFQDRVSFDELRTAVDQIRQFDRHAEHIKTLLRGVIGICAIGAIVGVICAFNLKNSTGLIVGAVLGVGWIGATVYSFSQQRNDLPNRRYQLAEELSRALNRDMPRDASLNLKLILSPADEAQKKVAQKKQSGWDVTFFEDPWLQLEGKLADETAVQISIVERLQKRIKRTRSSSGKLKTKTKSRSSTVATVRLSPKRKLFPQVDQMNDRVQTIVRIPPWAQLKKAMVNSGKLTISAATSEDWDVLKYAPKAKFDGGELVFSMLLSLYQVLHESRTSK